MRITTEIHAPLEVDTQDSEGELSFYWDKEEVEGISLGIRSAIEVVVLYHPEIFKKQMPYGFSTDLNGKMTLHRAATLPVDAVYLSTAMNLVWLNNLKVLLLDPENFGEVN